MAEHYIGDLTLFNTPINSRTCSLILFFFIFHHLKLMSALSNVEFDFSIKRIKAQIRPPNHFLDQIYMGLIHEYNTTLDVNH